MSNCLYCYQPLTNNEQDFHPSCSNKIFGQPTPPALPYSEADLDTLAREVIQSKTAITGVQAKLSLHRKTIYDSWLMGRIYIKATNSNISTSTRSRRSNHAPGSCN